MIFTYEKKHYVSGEVIHRSTVELPSKEAFKETLRRWNTPGATGNPDGRFFYEEVDSNGITND